LSFAYGGHRYKIDGQPVKSVTTLLKVLSKDALVQWAANSAADFATDHWDDLALKAPSERRALIARAHQRARDKAAAKGTQVHAWADDLLAGRPVEIPDEHVATVEAFARWWERAGFTTIATERAVWSPADDLEGRAYAGRFDLLAEHPRWGVTLIDWKSGKSVYSDFAVQLAAYAGAWNHVDGDQDIPAPLIRTLAVVHITPDGPTLHTLDHVQRGNAQARWDLVRALASHDLPEFQQEAL
jgi:hypothetical protein